MLPSAKIRPIVPAFRLSRVLVDEVEDQHRTADVAEQVERPGAGGDAAQVPVRDDVADARASLLPHGRPLALGGIVRGRSGLTATNETDEQRGSKVAQRVERDRERRADELDEEAGDGRPGDRRGRARELELRVALDQLVALDDARQVRLVGDIEEDLERARQEGDNVDLDEREPVAEEGDRDGCQERRARDVGTDEDGPAPHPIDPHARRQREEDPRQEADDAEDAELEGISVQDQRGQQRHAEQRDLVAELADRLAGPELHEVALPPQARPMWDGRRQLLGRRLAARAALDRHFASPSPAQSGV